jgi:thioredoxin 1
MIVDADGKTFEETIKARDLPVVIDFWAPWCGPCKVVAPSLEALSEKYEGQVRFIKVNIDDEPEAAQQYGVRSIPTLLMFNKDIVPINSIIGAVGKPVIEKAIEKILTSNK